MSFAPHRLRRGEWLAGLGAVVLLLSMFLLTWYGPTGTLSPTASLSPSANGWQALTTARWVMLITIVLALALACLQGARRSPAVPVSLSVFVTVFALITVVILIDRVLIDPPGGDLAEAKAGAYIGLLSAVVMLVGGFFSMRDEGIHHHDAPQEIEKLQV